MGRNENVYFEDNCANGAINKLFKNEADLCVIRSESGFKYSADVRSKPVVYLNFEMYMGKARPCVNYVIFVKEFPIFQEDLRQLMRSEFWSKLRGPRGRYLIVNENDVDGNDTIQRGEVYSYLWTFGIYRVVMMQNHRAKAFYAANPFAKRFKEDALGSCGNLSNLQFVDYVLRMDKKKFRHSTGYYYLPYTGNPGSKYQGITLSLLELVKTKLNISVVYHVSSNEENNEFYVTGMTNTTRDLIYNGSLDSFFISNLYLHYYETYEITDNAYVEEQMWIIAKPPLKTGAEILISVFTPQGWLCLLVTCALSTIFFWLLALIENEQSCSQISSSFLAIYGADLGIYAATRHLNSKYLKLVLFLHLLYSVIVFNAVHGCLSSLFANPGLQSGVNTFEEMLDSDVKPFWNMQKIALLEGHKSMLAQRLRAKSIAYDSVTSPRNRVEFVKTNRNYCTTAYDSYLQLYGTDGIRIIGREFLIPHDVRFGLKKGHPYVPHFNRVINAVQESGLVRKWVSDLKNRTGEGEGEANGRAIILTKLHLKGAFDLLLCGAALGAVVFLLELCWCKSVSVIRKNRQM